MKASEQINDGDIIPVAGATEAMQMDDLIASISTLDCIDIDYVHTPITKNTFNSSLYLITLFAEALAPIPQYFYFKSRGLWAHSPQALYAGPVEDLNNDLIEHRCHQRDDEVRD
ncbi:hypothetical protein EVAR_45064_1 [Eumeta japonica]|uniref:Uncharacterized protein n=1 Tax=Eumeta variegata TaxID=151549 RepID=A0A4C1XTI6_EUMVA|nr:hypothetical protein EVAR_45064_1 [Eumeta japonica]